MKQIVFGAMLILAGIVLVLNHRDIFAVFSLWPLLIVGFGLARVLGGCCARERRGGFWMLGIGGWLSLNKFTTLSAHDTWPLLLVIVGTLIAWDAMSPSERCTSCAEGHHAR